MKFWRNKRTSVVFVPKANGCSVDSTYKLLIDSKRRRWDFHYITSFKEPFKIKSRKVIVFAHPDEDNMGLKPFKGYKPILPGNFCFEKSGIEIFGFVCFGSRVLRSRYWEKLNSNWISFDSLITICIGIPALDNFWRSFFKYKIKCFSNEESIEDCFVQVRSKMYSDISNFENSDQNGSQVAVACLTGMVNSLKIK